MAERDGAPVRSSAVVQWVQLSASIPPPRLQGWNVPGNNLTSATLNINTNINLNFTIRQNLSAKQSRLN